LAKGESSDERESGKTILVFNKVDIAKSIPENRLCVSAKTGKNMDKLRAIIIERASALVSGSRTHEFNHQEGEVLITNERHRACLLKTCKYLSNAKSLAQEGRGNELISFEIREAINALGEIIGKTTNEDILNNIFAKFCIGK